MVNTVADVRVKAIVILGFALSALASLIDYFETVTTRGYQFNSLREIVIPVLNPLVMIAVVCAWWWLTGIETIDEAQRTNLRRAFLAFTVQYLFTTVLIVFFITPFRPLGAFWLTGVLWLELLGALVSTLGLFLMSQTLRSRASIDGPVLELG